MVHFNRLKPCPKNTRLSVTVDGSPPDDSNTTTSNLEDSHKQMHPANFDIELIYDDDDDDNITAQATPPALSSTDSTATRQYPLRQRHPQLG